MDEISLKSYDREIKDLIDSGDTQHAILHCTHILQTYPKHVDTNRLLGEAYLESKDYESASEKFQQVLASFPDDFPAHIGMSILREEQQCFDEACWHMERAFESQPASDSIQNELSRLKTKRDGVQVEKIRLNRGALARLYVKGGLYSQAISEIYAILKEDDSRFDLRAILAQILLETGQEVQAAGEAELVLTSLPYCFTANWVMAEFYKKRDQIGNYELFLEKLIEIDPYLDQPHFFTSTINPLPEESFVLEKYIITTTEEVVEAGSVAGVTYVVSKEMREEDLGIDEVEALDEAHEIIIPAEGTSETDLQPVQHSDWTPETFPESQSDQDTRPLQQPEVAAESELRSSDYPLIEETDLGEDTTEIPDWLRELADEEEPVAQDVQKTAPDSLKEEEQTILPEEILHEPVLFNPDVQQSSDIMKARDQLNQGQISEAIQLYDRSIKNRSSLPTVIADLELIREKHPDNPDIWRKLGDAYLRNQQISEAMQAYTEAEELSK